MPQPGGLSDRAWSDGGVEDAAEPNDETEDWGCVHGRPLSIGVTFNGWRRIVGVHDIDAFPFEQIIKILIQEKIWLKVRSGSCFCTKKSSWDRWEI